MAFSGQILPHFEKRMAGTAALWLENICDWCISRQLRWGHRIPAWYVTFDQSDEAAARDFPVREFGAYNTNWVVARTDEDARRAAKKKFPGRKFELGRDPDVLDTWFSSWLFPFSVFGWPEETADFKTFYPTALLETGHDILFFWVARMVFTGLRLTGQLSFKQVSAWKGVKSGCQGIRRDERDVQMVLWFYTALLETGHVLISYRRTALHPSAPLCTHGRSGRTQKLKQ
ncbi:unnamed protein product [Closterium sp. NIES-64]|nr:unnamed protein product [Closterium sp. NIES-64]